MLTFLILLYILLYIFYLDLKNIRIVEEQN